YQVVVRKGQFKIGDLGVYVQPDSIVPQIDAFSFVWADFLKEHPEVPPNDVPERRRRVTVRRFRKEYSEGLLLPISDFGFNLDPQGKYVGLAYTNVKEGDDVSELLGITHW